MIRAALPLLALALLAMAMLLLGGPGSAADQGLLTALQSDTLVPAARLLTRLGDWSLVLVAGVAASAWLFFRGERRNALVLLALILSERLLVEGLKELFDRTRPDPAGHLIAVKTMAFPSGHAANAAVLGLGIALLLVPPRHRLAAVAVALAYAFLIGLTRLVLGVHWPSDVVAGWALGALWVLLLARLSGGTSGAERH
jgi:undecaprenyl-diphosphatase